jgi:5'-methylthioadenosine phosphorylase
MPIHILGDSPLPENNSADIGIFGGSGFYKLLDNAEELTIETPYGMPSAPVTVGTLSSKRVAFMPRHGSKHEYPPHKINFRANMWAMKSLGITRIISPCAVGTLKRNIEPGHFVLADQYVDRTTGRADTFYDGPGATHVSAADPYCPELRSLAEHAGSKAGITVHPRGTVVVIQGPRFSTRSESKWFSGMGWDVINMSQYPEAHLARELELCVLNISLVTDYDCGFEDIPPVSHELVTKVFNENLQKLRVLLVNLLETVPLERNKCKCGQSLVGAAIS